MKSPFLESWKLVLKHFWNMHTSWIICEPFLIWKMVIKLLMIIVKKQTNLISFPYPNVFARVSYFQWEYYWFHFLSCWYSLIHLILVIARAHAITQATSLMHVKNKMRHFCVWHFLSGTLEWRKLKKEQKHQMK